MAAPRRARDHQGSRGSGQGRAARQGARRRGGRRRSSGSASRSTDALAKQNEDIAKLQAKLADAKAREQSIAARHKTAANRIKLRTQLHDERITDAFARFEQVERALDEMEGKVEAFDLGRKQTLSEELRRARGRGRRRRGAEGAEGAARQPHPPRSRALGVRSHACSVGFVLGIIFLTVVAPLWIIFHYITLLAPGAAALGRGREGAGRAVAERAAHGRAHRGAGAGARRRGAGLAHARKEAETMAWTNSTHRYPPLARPRARHHRRRLRRHRRLYRRRADRGAARSRWRD